MDAAIIAIGSELLTPQRVDTNSLFITASLNGLGVEVVSKAVIGDDRSRLTRAMRRALDEAGILILTGGLGPTEDDLTREAVADLCGRALVFREDIVRDIEDRFRRFNRKMADNNLRQAYIVEGAEVLPNPNGTAPGQWLDFDGKPILLLPGPPREMEPMFVNFCLPKLASLLPARVIRTRVFRIAGMGESDVDQLIAPVYKQVDNPATTILAALGDVQVHLRARASSGEEAEALLQPVAQGISELLGDRIYSRNGDPLERVVGGLMVERGHTLAVAESCTGGMLAERVTSVPGSSRYFIGGFLTYTYSAKAILLDIDPELLATHKAVSEPMAIAMADAARTQTAATIGLSVTGVAGPDPGLESEPVGTVILGISTVNGSRARRLQFGGDRHRVRVLAVQIALDLLRRYLLN